jgi:hypothetical protein
MPDAGESAYLPKIAVVTSVEDPDKKFWEEQRKKLRRARKSLVLSYAFSD